eukprot:2515280-Prymnesium_polylepis.1
MRSKDRAGFSRLPTNATPSASPCAQRVELTLWVLAWYVMSIGMTLFNKVLFTSYGLHFPLSITSLHFALKLGLARIAMAIVGVPSMELVTRRALCSVVPTGLATAADVALSNQAFLYISVTYYTIVKSSVPLWILAFSVAFGLKRAQPQLLLVLALILSGITLASVDPSEIVQPVVGVSEAGSGSDRRFLSRDALVQPPVQERAWTLAAARRHLAVLGLGADVHSLTLLPDDAAGRRPHRRSRLASTASTPTEGDGALPFELLPLVEQLPALADSPLAPSDDELVADDAVGGDDHGLGDDGVVDENLRSDGMSDDFFGLVRPCRKALSEAWRRLLARPHSICAA